MTTNPIRSPIVQRSVFRKNTNMFLDVIQIFADRCNSINGTWPTFGRVGHFIVDDAVHELREPTVYEATINHATTEEVELMIAVPAAPLRELLAALNGPRHLIAELKVITNSSNPIIVLTDVWNEYAETQKYKEVKA